MMIAQLLRTLAILTLFGNLSLAGNVWIVDSNGTGDFLRLQAAADAASSGDTLLVKPGWYAGATISGKGLQIIGEPGGHTYVSTALVFKDQEPTHDVFIANLYGSFVLGTELTKPAHQAHVLVESCQTYLPNPDGIRLNGSFHSLAVVDSQLTGLGEPKCCAGCGYPKGSAIRRNGDSASRTFLFQSVTWGGSGSDGCCWTCQPGGSGATGIVYSGDLLFAMMTSMYGGGGGCGCPGGADGSPLVFGQGQFDLSTAPDCKLQVPRIVVEGQQIQGTIDGTPGSMVTLLLSRRLGSRHNGPRIGPLLLDEDLLSLPLGVIDATGTFQFTTQAPSVAASEDGQMLYFQALLTDPLGQLSLTNPRGMLVLDS